ncbi:uncharacterized protein I206_106562 [Kwoniella pini CBS 10737]|uniref:BTB domain-containing protein n=1 Tax=Kwoniella pini CBS 10737 TaxID=1296096 RepID=A0A1B9HTU5_9TREE|nr:uncharacterized protein I206_07547 [Kwoniella pini CBS 10737]OCF46692.1 hypothetical protein I206_07547 [Kwoniella pini CBS 10737]
MPESSSLSPKRPASDDLSHEGMKKAKSPTKINKYNKDYQDPEADVTLVASDGYQFKVSSYVLKAASTVFRDMFIIGDNASREVSLTDKTFEGSRTLAMFLAVCHGKPIFPPTDKLQGYDSLVSFARKYDAPMVTQQLTTAVYQWYHDHAYSPFDIFKLGCSLDQPRMVAFAIRNSGNYVWVCDENASAEALANFKDPVKTVENVPSIPLLNLYTWNFKSFKAIPDEYKWALSRAQHGPGGTFKTDLGEIADGFFSLMKLMGKIE